MKDYADKRRNAKPSKLQTGDTVLVQQDKENKFTTPFDPRPYKVTNKKGSMVTAKIEDREITRYSSHFKSVLNPPDLPGTDENEDILIKEKQDDAVAQGTKARTMQPLICRAGRQETAHRPRISRILCANENV